MSDSIVKARKRGRGGRPGKGPRISMTVRCPEPLADAIEAARLESGLTTNDLVVCLVERAIEAGLVPVAASAGQERLPLSA